jgi:hypothetical protein
VTSENENAYRPETEDEGDFPVHPFTEDEPVTTGQSTDETLAPVGDDPLTREAGEPVRYETDEPVPAGVSGGQRAGVTELGPLLGGNLTGEFQQSWKDIQSGFVEDPENAVRRAEDLTDKIISSLTQALEDRRQTLDTSARNGDTEQLRLVLRQYRDTLESVTSL